MKKINIKNYTSGVDASVSIARIEKLLVSAGARDIMKKYNDQQQAIGIAFILPMDSKHLTFNLKANIEPIYDKLYAEYTRPSPKSKEICADQAERTAWKILSDWVEIQISMIALEQVEVLQAFFPYLSDGKQTFYDRLKENGFKQLNQ